MEKWFIDMCHMLIFVKNKILIFEHFSDVLLKRFFKSFLAPLTLKIEKESFFNEQALKSWRLGTYITLSHLKSWGGGHPTPQ